MVFPSSPAIQTLKWLPVTLAAVLSFQSGASIVITGTRVVYPTGERAVSVKLNNNGKQPVLIQNWVDDGDSAKKPDDSSAPFIVTPPVNRVDPGKGQTLRISYTGNSLPSDRESVFWLNVLEVPAKHNAAPNENYLQVAFRTRIKLFYRPANLPGSPQEAPDGLKWTASAGRLTAINNSVWNVSISRVSAGGKKAAGKMISPRGQESFALQVSPGAQITFDVVNDYGAVMQKTAVVR